MNTGLIMLAVIDKDPHELYKRVIAIYKGELVMWYHEIVRFYWIYN